MGSVSIPRSRMDADGNTQSFFDAATGETLASLRACRFKEDFTGPGFSATLPTSAASGIAWIQKTVQTGGTPSVAVVSNAAGGVVRLALDSTSEKQEATLYAADVLNWDMTKSAIFECRAAFHVLPTGVAQIVMGLQSAWIDGPNNASFYAQFEALASGAINRRTKDGVNTLSKACGVTVVADAMHLFRIDAADPTNVLFLIDGAVVSVKDMSFAATGANAILQPYFGVYKASGTGVGTLDVDMAHVAMNRS